LTVVKSIFIPDSRLCYQGFFIKQFPEVKLQSSRPELDHPDTTVY